jgi:hypothetical protein
MPRNMASSLQLFEKHRISRISFARNYMPSVKHKGFNYDLKVTILGVTTFFLLVVIFGLGFDFKFST